MVCPPCVTLDMHFPIIFPLHPNPALLGSQSSVHGILQERILEWVAIPFSGGSPQPRNQTHVSYIGRQILYCLSHQRSPFLVRKHHESLYMISLSALVPPLSPVFHTLCFIVGRREILNK